MLVFHAWQLHNILKKQIYLSQKLQVNLKKSVRKVIFRWYWDLGKIRVVMWKCLRFGDSFLQTEVDHETPVSQDWAE